MEAGRAGAAGGVTGWRGALAAWPVRPDFYEFDVATRKGHLLKVEQ